MVIDSITTASGAAQFQSAVRAIRYGGTANLRESYREIVCFQSAVRAIRYGGKPEGN